MYRIPCLTNLATTLRLVPGPLLWIVVEDGTQTSSHVFVVLEELPFETVYLHAKRPARNRGYVQRNEALRYIREHNITGVVYFADDDNTYDVRLFDEARKVPRGKVGLLPIGDIGAGRFQYNSVERPKVVDGRVAGWLTDHVGRPYNIDMAGIVVHTSLFHSRPKVWFIVGGESNYKDGWGETRLLEALLDGSYRDIVPLAKNCTEVLVWHTKPINQYKGRPYYVSWQVPPEDETVKR